MELIELKLEDVTMELKNLKLKKNQNIVWKSFQYNENTLETVKDAISLISYRDNEYRLTYDEDLIFVEKDIWP
jgi:hypothetical protein